MGNEAKVTEAPTIAEKMGIKYKEVDGLFYPVWGETDTDSYAMLGKFAHRWMTMLMEHDRYLYNQYFLDGTLVKRAKANEEYCWELHDSVVENLKKSRGFQEGEVDIMGKLQKLVQIEFTAEEIVNADLYERIDYHKRVRLNKAKESIASRQAEAQRMEG